MRCNFTVAVGSTRASELFPNIYYLPQMYMRSAAHVTATRRHPPPPADTTHRQAWLADTFISVKIQVQNHWAFFAIRSIKRSLWGEISHFTLLQFVVSFHFLLFSIYCIQLHTYRLHDTHPYLKISYSLLSVLKLDCWFTKTNSCSVNVISFKSDKIHCVKTVI